MAQVALDHGLDPRALIDGPDDIVEAMLTIAEDRAAAAQKARQEAAWAAAHQRNRAALEAG